MDQKIILKEFVDKRKLVKYSVGDFPIGWIVEQFMAGKIKIPTYQRKFRWSTARQSKFIESVLLGLPIPSIFLSKDGYDNRNKEIVDGSQRIRTLVAFMCDDDDFLKRQGIKKLKLSGLKMLKSINKCYYYDLPDDLKNELSDAFLRINLLDTDISSDVKIQIFERINNGSVELSQMEKRAGIYASPFIDFIYDKLCKEKNVIWDNIYKLSDSKKDKAVLEELILRAIVYSEKISDNKIDGYSGSSGTFFDIYCEEKIKEYESNPEKYRMWENIILSNFNDALNFFSENKRIDGVSYLMKIGPKGKYIATNVQFEAIFIGALLAIKKIGVSNLCIDNFKNWIDSVVFKKIVRSDGSNETTKVLDRITSVEKSFEGLSIDNIENSLLFKYT